MTCIVLFEVNSYREIIDLLFNTSAEPQSCDLYQIDLTIRKKRAGSFSFDWKRMSSANLQVQMILNCSRKKTAGVISVFPVTFYKGFSCQPFFLQLTSWLLCTGNSIQLQVEDRLYKVNSTFWTGIMSSYG